MNECTADKHFSFQSTSTVEETMELLHRGNHNRTVEPTKKNESYI